MTGLCEASTTVRTTMPAFDADAGRSPLAQQAAKVQAIGVADSITPSSISSTLTPSLPSEPTVAGSPRTPLTVHDTLDHSKCYETKGREGLTFPHEGSPTKAYVTHRITCFEFPPPSGSSMRSSVTQL